MVALPCTICASLCQFWTVSDKRTLQNWLLCRSIFSTRPQQSRGPHSLLGCYSVLIGIFSYRRQDNGPEQEFLPEENLPVGQGC